jgi:hypothetical protein
LLNQSEKQMNKSYSQFTAQDIRNLGISVEKGSIFGSIAAENPSAWLLETLSFNRQLPLSSEKARSELLITPVLVELKRKNPLNFTFFSGYQFDVDKKQGLKGFCDFIISRKHNAVFVESPLVAIVEVKQEQDLYNATPQCIAEMYAAQLYNEQNNETVPIIYGVVSTGFDWLFLSLQNKRVIIHADFFYIDQLNKLLGAWQCCLR